MVDDLGKQIGQYLLIKKLGCGGFGCVYQGTHSRLPHRTVAIKMFLDHVGAEEDHDNFIREALLLDQLRHPNIVPLLDLGIEQGALQRDLPYLIMEYAPQGSLRDRLKATPGPWSHDVVLPLLTQIGEALQFAHAKNIVHRDLKPENILFGPQDQVWLADFGIAVVLSSAKTKQGDLIGSIEYMAPEQFEGKASIKSDQYALGCIAYELLTGKKPFTAPEKSAIMYQQLHKAPRPLRQLNTSVPTTFEQAVLKALSKQREDRYNTITDFLAALHTMPPIPSSSQRAQRPTRLVIRDEFLDDDFASLPRRFSPSLSKQSIIHRVRKPLPPTQSPETSQQRDIFFTLQGSLIAGSFCIISTIFTSLISSLAVFLGAVTLGSGFVVLFITSIIGLSELQKRKIMWPAIMGAFLALCFLLLAESMTTSENMMTTGRAIPLIIVAVFLNLLYYLFHRQQKAPPARKVLRR